MTIMFKRILCLFLLFGLYVAVVPFAAASVNTAQVGQGRYGLLLMTGKATHHSPKRHAGFAVLLFERAAPTFNYRLTAHGLQARQDYTLIYFPAPWPGDNLRCIGQAHSNRSGMLRLHGRVDLNTGLPVAADDNYPHGASLRLVLSSDVDCESRRFVDWHPGAYLFGRRLIRYTDTDLAHDYTGRYCLSLAQPAGEQLTNMDLVQSGDTVTASIEGFRFTGSVSAGGVRLSGIGPDDLVYDIELTFSEDGESFSGTVSTPLETLSTTGTKGPCFGYEDPPGVPECQLPVADPSLVTRGQQFNSVSGSTVHNGLDFKFGSPLPTILAPCDGVVMGISVHPIAWGNLIIDVGIRFNADWSYYIAFEPYTPDPVIADQQHAEIAVTVGQVVRRCDVLGRLVVGDTEYPHIHWGVTQSGVGPVCPRDILSATEQLELDALYASVGLSPACLPAP